MYTCACTRVLCGYTRHLCILILVNRPSGINRIKGVKDTWTDLRSVMDGSSYSVPESWGKMSSWKTIMVCMRSLMWLCHIMMSSSLSGCWIKVGPKQTARLWESIMFSSLYCASLWVSPKRFRGLQQMEEKNGWWFVTNKLPLERQGYMVTKPDS